MPLHETLQIAVIEDDPIMGESLLQRLTLEGYGANWYRTGEEALTQMKATKSCLASVTLARWRQCWARYQAAPIVPCGPSPPMTNHRLPGWLRRSGA